MYIYIYIYIYIYVYIYIYIFAEDIQITLPQYFYNYKTCYIAKKKKKCLPLVLQNILLACLA